MSEAWISVFNLLAAVLVFLTAMLPTIRQIFSKVAAIEDKEWRKQIIFMSTAAVLLTVGWLARFWRADTVTLACFLLYTIVMVANFVRKKTTPTRFEILGEAVGPIALTVFWALTFYTDLVAKQILQTQVAK